MKYADELINEYTTDLRPIKAIYNHYRKHRNICLILSKECEEAQAWDLSIEYKQEYEEYRALAKELGPIISSSEYSIQWLADGKEPGNRREIGRRSNYQKTTFYGDVQLAVVAHLRDEDQYTTELSGEKKEILDQIMNELSPRQQEVVYSIMAKENTYEATANYLGISRSTVQSYMNDATQKIHKILTKGSQTSLF